MLAEFFVIITYSGTYLSIGIVRNLANILFCRFRLKQYICCPKNEIR